MTNTTPPYPYVQLASSNELDDFALIDAWLLPSGSPSNPRRIPRTSGLQVLSWLICESVAGLPPTTAPTKAGGSGARDLTNYHVTRPADIGGNTFGKGQVQMEYTFYMCHVTRDREILKCVGVVILELDVWLRKD
ncbi:MAG: hypothetical protein Q9176_002385 [Flavoplaca citrina]